MNEKPKFDLKQKRLTAIRKVQFQLTKSTLGIMKKVADECINEILTSEDPKLSKELQEAISNTDPADFLTYLFNEYNGASLMDSCFLLLFEYWKDFTFETWQSIFQKISDKNSGQYYLNFLFRSYLGINPGFDKYKNEEPVAISFPDNQIISNTPIFRSEGYLRKRYESNLKKNGITLEMLENISNRLILEGAESIMI